MNTPLTEARKVLESLEELVVDPQISFGPAFAGARNRQAEAITIMQQVVAQLENKQRSSP